ncbi:MAG: hypothetical protein K0R12_693 [Gammaproteobacteria bacterium]|jgi:hypothetical protein|nr:hypothetical protein [Gammaproteobacteria bacterium]
MPPYSVLADHRTNTEEYYLYDLQQRVKKKKDAVFPTLPKKVKYAAATIGTFLFIAAVPTALCLTFAFPGQADKLYAVVTSTESTDAINSIKTLPGIAEIRYAREHLQKGDLRGREKIEASITVGIALSALSAFAFNVWDGVTEATSASDGMVSTPILATGMLSVFAGMKFVSAGVSFLNAQVKTHKPYLLKDNISDIKRINEEINTKTREYQSQIDAAYTDFYNQTKRKEAFDKAKELAKEKRELIKKRSELETESIILYKTLSAQDEEIACNLETSAKIRCYGSKNKVELKAELIDALTDSGENSRKSAAIAAILDAPATEEETLAADLIMECRAEDRDIKKIEFAQRGITFGSSLLILAFVVGVACPPLLTAAAVLSVITLAMIAGHLAYNTYTHYACRQVKHEMSVSLVGEKQSSKQATDARSTLKQQIGDREIRKNKGTFCDPYRFFEDKKEKKMLCHEAYHVKVKEQVLARAIEAKASTGNYGRINTQAVADRLPAKVKKSLCAQHARNVFWNKTSAKTADKTHPVDRNPSASLVPRTI